MKVKYKKVMLFLILILTVVFSYMAARFNYFTNHYRENIKDIEGNTKKLPVSLGNAIKTHRLFYKKLYIEKPYPDAEITYWDNGVYRIVSEGEDHFGVYVIDGNFDSQIYHIRYISLPSKDWSNKTAFHKITFINDAVEPTFIQNAIIYSGEKIEGQYGSFYE